LLIHVKIPTHSGFHDLFLIYKWGHREHDHMIVGFTTTYAISAYHH
jgi:hypothetical protein